MRKTILVTTATAFVLASVGPALAAPPFSEIKKDDAIMNPHKAEAALAKSEAKDAKKNAKVAQKKAHVATKQAKVATHKADAAAKAAAKG